MFAHYPFCAVNVNAVMSTSAPLTIETVVMTMFAVEVPTDPSKTAVVPSDFRHRNQVAVPVALALVSAVMLFADATPDEAVANAVDPNRSSARSTWVLTAVSAVAGCVPS